MSSRAFVAMGGLAALLWAFSNWRWAVRVAMVALIIEGAVRKWVFPGSQDLVYFGKDVLLLGAYGGYFVERARIRFPAPQIPPLYAALLAAAAYGLIEAFNPRLPNVLVGLLGFKAYFFYVPLLFVLPAAFSSDTALARFLARYAVLAVPVGLLAVAQFLSPAGSALNTYARSSGETGYVSTFGSSEFVRVTATFSYITGYSSYLLATTILLLSILGTTRWRLRGNFMVFAALGMTLLGMLMTGSRGPVLLIVLLFPLYWWLTVAREKGGGRTFARLLIGAALVAAFLVRAGGSAIEAFAGRAAGSGDMAGRMIAPFVQPFDVFADAGLFGFGIGASHQTAAAVVKDQIPYSWIHFIIVETESSRVMLEMGGLGFALIYFVRIYLVFFAFQQARRLRTPFHRAVATSSLLFFLAQLPGGIIFDVTAGVYFWFFAGLLTTVMSLDRATAPVPVRSAPPGLRRIAEPRVPDPAPGPPGVPSASW